MRFFVFFFSISFLISASLQAAIPDEDYLLREEQRRNEELTRKAKIYFVERLKELGYMASKIEVRFHSEKMDLFTSCFWCGVSSYTLTDLGELTRVDARGDETRQFSEALVQELGLFHRHRIHNNSRKYARDVNIQILATVDGQNLVWSGKIAHALQYIAIYHDNAILSDLGEILNPDTLVRMGTLLLNSYSRISLDYIVYNQNREEAFRITDDERWWTNKLPRSIYFDSKELSLLNDESKDFYTEIFYRDFENSSTASPEFSYYNGEPVEQAKRFLGLARLRSVDLVQ